MRIAALAIFGLFTSPWLHAAPLQGTYFAHKDWELACDNTGTCRAAGYSEGKVSLLLTRPAGPGESFTLEVAFAQQTQGQPPKAEALLLINNAPAGKLNNTANGDFILDYAQRQSVLHALRQDEQIEFSLNGERIALSASGSNAVLLKMDEFQRRVGTNSALLSPGKNNNNAVLVASPKPEIITQPVIAAPNIEPLTALQKQKIAGWIQPTAAMNCSELEEGRERTFDVIPLDNSHSLIRTECFDISRFALWVTDNSFSKRPQLITNDAADYQQGKIWQYSGPIRAWVWDGQQFALADEYHDNAGQGNTLSIGGVWHLPTYVSTIRTSQEVDLDNAALKTFYRAVMKQKAANPEGAWENVAAQFPIKKPLTAFDISYNEDGPQPKGKPSADISDDEWQAFLNSNISADTESGNVSFQLVDLDGDGKRDLIIGSYVGGTGLFSYTGVLKRGDTAFYSTSEDDGNGDFGVPGALFSENGRGANQWSQWVEINGQVYALWFNGNFGEDNLYLIRPFSQAANTPTVTIRYYYDLNTLDSSVDEEVPAPPLSAKDKATLLKSLATMQQHLLKDRPAGQVNTAICPVPAGTSPEDAESYSMGTALHYAYEAVAYIPVWINDHCYIGTVASHFGAYGHGVDAEISLSSPEKDSEFVAGYAISGPRSITSVTSGYKQRVGDNGAL